MVTRMSQSMMTHRQVCKKDFFCSFSIAMAYLQIETVLNAFSLSKFSHRVDLKYIYRNPLPSSSYILAQYSSKSYISNIYMRLYCKRLNHMLQICLLFLYEPLRIQCYFCKTLTTRVLLLDFFGC